MVGQKIRVYRLDKTRPEKFLEKLYCPYCSIFPRTPLSCAPPTVLIVAAKVISTGFRPSATRTLHSIPQKKVSTLLIAPPFTRIVSNYVHMESRSDVVTISAKSAWKQDVRARERFSPHFPVPVIVQFNFMALIQDLFYFSPQAAHISGSVQDNRTLRDVRVTTVALQ